MHALAPLPPVLAVCAALMLGLGLVRAQSTDSPATQPATQPASQPARKTVQRALNPHWTTIDCRSCHQPSADGGVQPIPLERVNEICWRCHDGKQAHQEVHPVSRKFVGKDLVKPADWPAPNNELSCVTCHDFGAGHARGGPRPEQNAWMLRGYTGGSLTPFCAKCHVASPAHKAFNPHVMLEPDGSVDIRNCLLCHRASEGHDRKARLGKPDLVADEISVCIRCHTRHVDYFQPGHIGHVMPPEMKAYMLAREDSGLGAPVAPEEVDGYLDSTREPRLLPLGMNDRVVCSTCHNPHQSGLFPADSVLGRGGMKLDSSHRSRELRGMGKEICRACHNK